MANDREHAVLLTAERAAERLSLGRTTVYGLIASGELASVKVGRARRVPAGALDAYVARLSADAAVTE